MKLVTTYAGHVNFTRTIATMKEGETWRVPVGTFREGVARVTCSRFGKASGKSFSVSLDRRGRLTVTRNS